jgi:hypothetical protein
MGALDPTLIERVRLAHGFNVTNHTLTFHGLCAECAGRGRTTPAQQSPGGLLQ